MSKNFDIFKQRIVEVMEQTEPCSESTAEFNAAETVEGFVILWLKYWYDVTGKAREQVAQVFKDFHDEYIDEVHNARIYFNENADRGRLIVFDCDEPLTVSGTCHCYITGKGKVTAKDTSQVYCSVEDGEVTLRGSSYGNVSAGKVSAYEHSHLTTSVDAYCKGPVEVMITHGTLTTEGHKRIVASGDAVVKSFTRRGIEIVGNAQIIVE